MNCTRGHKYSQSDHPDDDPRPAPKPKLAYAPWKGFVLIGIGLAIDLAPGPIHRSGLPTMLGFFLAWGWSQA